MMHGPIRIRKKCVDCVLQGDVREWNVAARGERVIQSHSKLVSSVTLKTWTVLFFRNVRI